jgi:bifunctional non-homologous end joining protein LigD
LVYAGKVDNGLHKASPADLRKRLKPLIRKTQPYTKRIAHRGIWVEPELLAEIEYRAKSAGATAGACFSGASSNARTRSLGCYATKYDSLGFMKNRTG